MYGAAHEDLSDNKSESSDGQDRPPTFAAAVHAIETVRAFLESHGCTDYHSLYAVEKTVHNTKAKISVQCSIKDFLKVR